MEQRRSPLLSSSFAFPFLFFLEDEGNLLQNSSFYPILPPSVRPLAFTGYSTHNPLLPLPQPRRMSTSRYGMGANLPGRKQAACFPAYAKDIQSICPAHLLFPRRGATAWASEWRWRCTLNGRKWGISRCMERRFPTSLFSSDGEGRDGGSRLIHVCGYKNAKGKGESEGACI